MNNAHYKLVALDLDGTIITSDGAPDPELPKVISQLRAQDVRVVICTGRRWRTTAPVVEALDGLAPYVISCGGALIKNGVSHDTLHTIPLPETTATTIIRKYLDAGLVPFLLCDRDLQEPELLIPHKARHQAMEIRYVQENNDTIHFYEGDYPALDVTPLVVYTVDDKKLIKNVEPQIIQAIGEDGFLTSLHQPGYPADKWVLQVHNPNATKWHALQWLMSRWDITANEVIAIGDDVNDIPMLKNAALSYAPSNAVPQARSAADRITSSNDDNGVVEALKDVFF